MKKVNSILATDLTETSLKWLITLNFSPQFGSLPFLLDPQTTFRYITIPMMEVNFCTESHIKANVTLHSGTSWSEDGWTGERPVGSGSGTGIS